MAKSSKPQKSTPKNKPAKKKAPEKSAPKKAQLKKITRGSLIAVATQGSQPVGITFTFTSGIGQATASLFRNGLLINMQSVSSSGLVAFSDTQRGDVISINGVCAGKATITIDLPTTPVTPEAFDSGLIMSGYLIN